VHDARNVLDNATSAIDAQIALLDYADVYAKAAGPASGEKLGPVNGNGNKIEHQPTCSTQDAEPIKFEDEGLSLTNIVGDHRAKRTRRGARKNSGSSLVPEKDEKDDSAQSAPGVNRLLKVSEDNEAILEARVREL
jgi:hypothetical protein